MLPNHGRTDPEYVRHVLFGSAAREDLSRQRMPESVSMSARYCGMVEHGRQGALRDPNYRPPRRDAVPEKEMRVFTGAAWAG
jgi:hypothetical protein